MKFENNFEVVKGDINVIGADEKDVYIVREQESTKFVGEHNDKKIFIVNVGDSKFNINIMKIKDDDIITYEKSLTEVPKLIYEEIRKQNKKNINLRIPLLFLNNINKYYFFTAYGNIPNERYYHTVLESSNLGFRDIFGIIDISFIKSVKFYIPDDEHYLYYQNYQNKYLNPFKLYQPKLTTKKNDHETEKCKNIIDYKIDGNDYLTIPYSEGDDIISNGVKLSLDIGKLSPSPCNDNNDNLYIYTQDKYDKFKQSGYKIYKGDGKEITPRIGVLYKKSEKNLLNNKSGTINLIDDVDNNELRKKIIVQMKGQNIPSLKLDENAKISSKDKIEEIYYENIDKTNIYKILVDYWDDENKNIYSVSLRKDGYYSIHLKEDKIHIPPYNKYILFTIKH